MNGWLVQAGTQANGAFEMRVDLKGKLVNQPPTADACPSASRTSADACPDLPKVECNIPGAATFTLRGAASDPDNNIASIGWFRDGPGGPQVAAQLAGEVTQAVKTKIPYVLKVIDLFGQKDEDTATVEVVDTTPPTVTAPADVTAECNPASPGGGTAVDIGKATATDVCDLSPDITNNAPQLFSLGDTKVTWSATDDSTNVGTAIQTVHIIDTTPPDLSVTLTPARLWPPGHKLVTITANITVTDKCDPKPFVKLISVKSNEPDNGLGDGDQPNDIQSATGGPLVVNDDIRSFQVRQERGGTGTGRVYTVTYEASDHSGNKTQKTATVTVPFSQK